MVSEDGACAPAEPLRAEVERDGATTRVHIAGDAIEFEAAGPVIPSPPDETFALWVALPVAARLGRDLAVAGSGCPAAAANASGLTRVWEAWAPLVFRRVSARFEGDRTPPPPPARDRDLHLYSGGADSTYSLLDRRDRGLRQGLLTLHGLDYRLGDPDRFEALKAHCRGFAGGVADEWSFVRTNAYSVYSKHGVGPSFSHGFLLAGALFLFEGQYRNGVIAADHPLALEAWGHPWGTNSLTNRSFQSSSFEMQTAALDRTRAEKLDRIAEDPAALAALSLCKDYSHRPKNCGVCKKCIRTKALFLAARGEIPNIFTDPAFPDDAVTSIPADDRIEKLNLIDMFTTARARGNLDLLPGIGAAVKACTS